MDSFTVQYCYTKESAYPDHRYIEWRKLMGDYKEVLQNYNFEKEIRNTFGNGIVCEQRIYRKRVGNI